MLCYGNPHHVYAAHKFLPAGPVMAARMTSMLDSSCRTKMELAQWHARVGKLLISADTRIKRFIDDAPPPVEDAAQPPFPTPELMASTC